MKVRKSHPHFWEEIMLCFYFADDVILLMLTICLIVNLNILKQKVVITPKC